MSNFDFFIASMPKTRHADYYLGCLDGSVFIDFNDVNDFIRLIRISFDGYGCCHLGASALPLNKEDSDIFREIFQSGIIDQELVEVMVKKAISLNKPFIWTDALEEYSLI